MDSIGSYSYHSLTHSLTYCCALQLPITSYSKLRSYYE